MSAEGFAAVPNWMIRDLGADELSIYGLAVYTALASHSGKGGIRPSIKTLAKEARCGETKVREELANLEQLGVLKVVRRKKAKGVNDTNAYTLRPNGSKRRTSSHEARGTSPGEVGVPRGANQGTSWGEGEEEPLKKNPSRRTPNGVQGARIPEPFIVTREMREWAAREVPAVEVDSSTRVFVDYWRAATRNAVKRDWVAAWRNWLRKDAKDAVQRPRHLSAVDVGREADAILRARAAARDSGQKAVTA